MSNQITVKPATIVKLGAFLEALRLACEGDKPINLTLFVREHNVGSSVLSPLKKLNVIQPCTSISGFEFENRGRHPLVIAREVAFESAKYKRRMYEEAQHKKNLEKDLEARKAREALQAKIEAEAKIKAEALAQATAKAVIKKAIKADPLLQMAKSYKKSIDQEVKTAKEQINSIIETELQTTDNQVMNIENTQPLNAVEEAKRRAEAALQAALQADELLKQALEEERIAKELEKQEQEARELAELEAKIKAEEEEATRILAEEEEVGRKLAEEEAARILAEEQALILDQKPIEETIIAEKPSVEIKEKRVIIQKPEEFNVPENLPKTIASNEIGMSNQQPLSPATIIQPKSRDNNLYLGLTPLESNLLQLALTQVTDNDLVSFAKRITKRLENQKLNSTSK